MAYENLTYTNIAGEMTATYNDNNMRRQAQSSPATGPGLLMTATAKTGLDLKAFRAAASTQAVQDAAREFNVKSDLTRVLAAAQSIAGDRTPLNLMRIGAKPFHMILEKSTSGMQEKEAWIKITPYLTREEDSQEGLQAAQDQLGLILMPYREGSLIRQRVILYNTRGTIVTPVFDSEGILVSGVAEALFDVEISVPAGIFLYTPDVFATNILNPSTPTIDEIYALADIQAGMNTASSLNLNGVALENNVKTVNGYLTKINIVDEFLLTNSSLTAYNTGKPGEEVFLKKLGGSNGDFISHCERYAANEIAYEELEFENLAFLHCDKCYADVGAIELSGDMDLKYQASWQKHKLGYMWKYEFNGRPHVFMSARKNPFSSGNVAAEYIHDGVKYTLSNDQKNLGDVLNLVEYHFHPKVQGSDTEVESFFNDQGLIECHVSFDSDPATATDAKGRTQAQFNTLGVFSDGVDAGDLDDVTLLPQAEHTTYVNAGWIEAAGSIVVETPFATLTIDVTRFDADDKYNRNQVEWSNLPDYSVNVDGVDTVTGLIQAQWLAYVGVEINANATGTFTPVHVDHVVRLRPSMVGGSRALSSYALNAPDRIELDPFFMTHFELTGNLIPEAVMSRILTFVDPIYNGSAVSISPSLSLVASPVEIREVSFVHQSATAAYKASTNYSQTIAIVPCSPPSRSRNGISAWAGNPATYQIQSNGDVLVTTNGTGVLGTKLLAGATDYRGGAAFGGIILTNGDLLPNGIPYGIDDTDEALDDLGNPIDLGKHVIVVGAYGLVSDPRSAISTNGKKINVGRTQPYVANAGPMIAGLLSVLEPGTEPIGPIRGRLSGFDAQQRTPRAVLDNLAALRVCMIDQTGVISSIYTAALRTSDYSKVSSVLSANAILTRMRNECMQVIGTAYTDAHVSSLAQRLDGISKALVAQGYAQQLSVQLRGSQLDRINGILKLSVRFIPPLSIEAISIDLTLEPPTSGI